MNITSPGVQRAVKWFAHWMVTHMPSLSFDDAMQDLWLEVVTATPRYDDTENAFLTFIGRHLRWRAINMMEAEVTRIKYNTVFASESCQSYSIPDQSYDSLIELISKQLGPLDQKVFRTLADPPMHLVSDQIRERGTIANWRLASYLGVTKRQVKYSRIKIRKVIDRLLSEVPGEVTDRS